MAVCLYLIVLRQLVEPAKELVKRGHQLGGRQFFGEWREVHDVGVQDAVDKVIISISCPRCIIEILFCHDRARIRSSSLDLDSDSIKYGVMAPLVNGA